MLEATVLEEGWQWLGLKWWQSGGLEGWVILKTGLVGTVGKTELFFNCRGEKCYLLSFRSSDNIIASVHSAKIILNCWFDLLFF